MQLDLHSGTSGRILFTGKIFGMNMRVIPLMAFKSYSEQGPDAIFIYQI